jgi:hypothetical protein
VFTALRIHGAAASILWGHRPAVTLRSWSIAKVQGQWTLTGTIDRVDAFQCRQKPLLFTAPREGAHDGFWAWGLEGPIEIGNNRIRAKLGPPEQ